jgi:hypothetical protein
LFFAAWRPLSRFAEDGAGYIASRLRRLRKLCTQPKTPVR